MYSLTHADVHALPLTARDATRVFVADLGVPNVTKAEHADGVVHQLVLARLWHVCGETKLRAKADDFLDGEFTVHRIVLWHEADRVFEFLVGGSSRGEEGVSEAKVV
jgi:hypothetical protein